MDERFRVGPPDRAASSFSRPIYHYPTPTTKVRVGEITDPYAAAVIAGILGVTGGRDIGCDVSGNLLRSSTGD